MDKWTLSEVIIERLERPGAGSETVSVSLSCPELSVEGRDKRAGGQTGRGELRI